MSSKKIFIKNIALKAGVTESQVEKTIDQFFHELANYLRNGKKVIITRFGTFWTETDKKGKNCLIKFKASLILLRYLNQH